MLDAAALKNHSLALAIPEMQPVEYAQLVADIATLRQREPIVLFENMILDGRHRARARADLGIEVKAITFVGTLEEAEALVNTANVYRRHMTLEQKHAIISAELKRDPTQSDRALAKKIDSVRQQ